MRRLLFAAVAAILALTSCGGTANNNGNPTDSPVASGPPSDAPNQTDTPNQTNDDSAMSDYFPILTNTNYHYESPAGADFTQDIYVTYTNGNIIQRRAASAKVPTTEVLQIQNGEVHLIYGDPNYYFYENITTAEPIMDMLLLKEPFEQGQKWTQDASGQCEITAMDVPVTTPSGDYTAMEVTTKFSDGRQQEEYYAKGVGLVKTAYTTNDGQNIEISLTSIDKNAVLTVPADFYYPDPTQDSGFSKEERDININTNCDLVKLFNGQMKTAGAAGYVWLPGSTVINSIEVDRGNDTIILDLSDNEGVSTQDGLQAIANTLGQFYGVSKVRPTANGGDYTTADGKTFGASDTLSVIVEADQAVLN